MKRTRLGFAALLAAGALAGALVPVLADTAAGPYSSPSAAQPARAGIGKPAPDFTLANPDGKSFSLARERQGRKATVLMFISTQCPVSNAYNGRMVRIARDYSPKGVRFMGIDANRTESPEEVAGFARQHGFPFPVLIDSGNHVADRYDARVTPHIYLIDGKGILRYRGRIDDSQDESGVKSDDLRNALDAVLAGKPVPVAETRAFGCSIKRISRS